MEETPLYLKLATEWSQKITPFEPEPILDLSNENREKSPIETKLSKLNYKSLVSCRKKLETRIEYELKFLEKISISVE